MIKWIRLGSIPFHPFNDNSNNGTLIHFIPFHHISSHTTNPNIAVVTTLIFISTNFFMDIGFIHIIFIQFIIMLIIMINFIHVKFDDKEFDNEKSE